MDNFVIKEGDSFYSQPGDYTFVVKKVIPEHSYIYVKGKYLYDRLSRFDNEPDEFYSHMTVSYVTYLLENGSLVRKNNHE